MIGDMSQEVEHCRFIDHRGGHSQFGTRKRIGAKCNVAPVPRILGPCAETTSRLGTGKRGTAPKNSFVKALRCHFRPLLS